MLGPDHAEWRSGTKEMARRPWPGLASSTMVPVSAIATAVAVSTASIQLVTLSRFPVRRDAAEERHRRAESANRAWSMPCGTA